MSVKQVAPRPVARPGVPLWPVVVIACLAQFMVVLDSSIVNVALPAMKAGLHLSVNTQQWVVDGYLIAFGGLLLLAARSGDLFGRRRVFQLGLIVFTLASLTGGLAHDGAMLLAARFVQGAGAAALGPSSQSLITASHTDAAQRTRALAWWGVTASSAGAVGVVLGGVLTASLGWRWVFFVNIPLGAGLLAAAAGCLAASPGAADRPRLDIPGAVTVTTAVAALVYGVSRAPSDGWTSAGTLAAIGAGLVLLAAFAVIEVRTRESLIPLGLFSVPNVRIGNVLMVCLGVAITAPLFFLSLYLQQVLGDSALRAGLALLPMATVLSLGVIVSRRLMPLLGPGRLLTAGALVAAAGLAWLAWLPAHPAYLSHVLAPTLVAGCGMSVTLLPMTAAATTGVAPENTGVASGLFNMARQIGGAVGLAVLVTVASSVTRHSHAGGAARVVDGYHVALLVVAAVVLAAAAIATRLRPAAAAAAAFASAPAPAAALAPAPVPAPALATREAPGGRRTRGTPGGRR